MPDERLRLASLTVVGGALDGRRHDIVDVVGEILIGSDPDCQLCVDLPSISPIHARVWTELGQAMARDTSAPRGLYVNSVRVEKESVFGEGDVLWLGPPNEPESVCVQCRFEPWREVLPPAADQPADRAPISPSPDDAQDPFFIATEAPAEAARPSAASARPAGGAAVAPAPGPPPTAPAMSGSPTGEASVLPGVPDDAWTIGEAPPQLASPVVLPALSSQPAAGSAGGDEFFVADAPEPASGQQPLPAISPLPPAPAAPPAGGAKALGSPPSPARPPVSAPQRPAQSATPGAAPRPAAAGPRAPAAAPPKAAAPPAAAPPASAAPPAAKHPRPAGPVAGPTAARPLAPSAAKAAPAAPTAPAAAVGHARQPAPSARAPQAPPGSPSPRHAPPAARPAAPAARPAPAERRATSRPSTKRAGDAGTWLIAAAIAVGAVAVLVALASWRILGAVRLDAIEPSRVRVGQRAAIQGRGFSADPEANVVLFEDKRAKVLAATPVRLEVEVPEAVSEAGGERSVGVRVRRGSRSSNPISVSVLQGPRVHALSPQAAMPGEEVLLAGAGLGPGASVRFGDVPAQIARAEATRISIVVPELAGGPGTSVPLVVTVGGVDSNAVPFVVGHLPLVTAITPANATPGDVVRISGLGFLRDPSQNDVQIGGSAALVVSASDSTLEVVVPRVGPGEPARAVAIRVSGGTNVGAATLDVPPPADPIEPRFVAEPFAGPPARPYAVVATGLGPVFVLAASGGRTAAQRALQAQGRLNQALEVLRTTLGLTVEARGFGASPVITLTGRADVLLEVTDEDAAAYGEDWTGLRGRGGAVTRDRLARWWEAVGRDLVLLLVRGEKPRYAAQLAVEGRVLAQLFDVARKTGRPGVPRAALEQGRPPLRDGLRLVALRVPATVTAPVTPAAAGPSPTSTATSASARIPPLEGTLRGSELEAGERRYLTVTFEKIGGSIAFEGGITLTMPFLSLERRGNDQVRFTVEIRGGVRHYVGRWDGQKLVGTISTDEAGKEVVGTFDLHR